MICANVVADALLIKRNLFYIETLLKVRYDHSNTNGNLSEIFDEQGRIYKTVFVEALRCEKSLIHALIESDVDFFLDQLVLSRVISHVSAGLKARCSERSVLND